MLTAAQRILASSRVSGYGSEDHQRLGELMAEVEDKEALIRLAIDERLGGLLYKNLRRAGLLDTLERGQAEALQGLYRRTAVLNLRRIHDLGKVLAALSRQGIPVVLLKGIILLQQIYHDLGSRPMSDVDLWVREGDYPGLVEILLHTGYQRDPLYPDTFRKGLTTLDLHTHLLGADRIRSRTLLLTGDQKEIFGNTREVSFQGQGALCLGRYDQVLYLSLHALKHNVERLIWLVDIDGLVAGWQQSDWQALVDRATEMGQEQSIYCIAFLARHLLEDRRGPSKWKQAGSDKLGFLEKRILRRRIRGRAFPIWAPLVLFTARKGIRWRFLVALETLFPRPEILRQVIVGADDLKVWQLYLYRFWQLVGMVIRTRP
ncbi:MAG: nucleotidyltransferase family protein [Acidobacteriota bacterium]